MLVGVVYFFGFRAAMYVVRTAITAMTIAIKTAAVGQSMAFLRFATPVALCALLCAIDAICDPVGLSRAVGPIP
jgi:hypothetical protein